MKVKELIKKIIRKLLRSIYTQIEEHERMIFAQKDVVFKLNKINSQKIVVVFVCHRPALWGSLKSVYDSCVKNEHITPFIFAIPNKQDLPQMGLEHENYVDEGAYEYFVNQGYENVIKGYDFETGNWKGITELTPHYVFLQTPYDTCRPMHLRSKVISSYAKVCSVPYFVPFMNGDIELSSSPLEFLQNVSYLFAATEEQKELFEKILEKKKSFVDVKVVLSGAPKFDLEYDKIKEELSEWKYKKEKKIRVFWTPRWCVEENNCTFFDYKDKMVEFFDKHKEFELIFRPHPQAFIEYKKRGLMSESEIQEYKKLYDNSENMQIDSYQEYVTNFHTSDVLISDESSIISEYFLTGKPIIFTYKETHFTKFAEEMSKGFYWAANWDEVETELLNVKEDIDMKEEVRKEIIKKQFYIHPNGAGTYIVNTIVNDYGEM